MEHTNRRYVLTPGYALRGWKLLPYAIQYLFAPRTEFFREPTTNDRCPKCGARVYYEGEYGVSTGFLEGYNWKEFICRECGPYKVKDDGTIF